MRMHRHGLAALSTLTLGALLAGTGRAGDQDKVFKPFLPAAAYKELVGRASKHVAEGLALKSEEGIRKAQFNAVMIACYTLSTSEGGSPEELATVREAALRLAKLITQKGKLDQAKALAAEIPTLKAKAGAKKEVGDLKSHIDERADLMEFFKLKSKGGDGIPPSLQSNIRLKDALNGIEEKLRFLIAKPMAAANVAKESEELALLGYRTAAAGELTYLFAPAKKTAKNDPKDWQRYSLEMRDTGIALAAAAKKKDAEAIFKASELLNNSCNRCHTDFR